MPPADGTASGRTDELLAMIEPVIEIAGAAGDAIEEVRRNPVVAEDKEPGHQVTVADRTADDLLRERLRALLPCAWLSEETVDSPDRLAESWLWVVDPLDGTKEFIAGVPEYAVSVALVADRRPVLAVVWHPPARRAFWAVRGAGAHSHDGPLRVGEGRRILASRTEMKRGEFDPFGEKWDIEARGSIALKLALVARGDAALTLSRGPKSEWDVCAGVLLVEEAGGIVTAVSGDPFQFNGETARVDGIVAGAPDAWRRGFDVVRRLGRVRQKERR
jgi:myo-inositol-1(or 4)-monophosphatase